MSNRIPNGNRNRLTVFYFSPVSWTILTTNSAHLIQIATEFFIGFPSRNTQILSKPKWLSCPKHIFCLISIRKHSIETLVIWIKCSKYRFCLTSKSPRTGITESLEFHTLYTMPNLWVIKTILPSWHSSSALPNRSPSRLRFDFGQSSPEIAFYTSKMQHASQHTLQCRSDS